MKLLPFKTLIVRFIRELKFYQRVLSHPRCPRLARFFLGIAITYALSPIDLIPDFIPVLGYLDDIIILPVLIFIALRLIPKDLIEEARLDMRNELRF
jgi:uncharacterized membrane protein YkvA (DUF1232 family)